MIGDPREGACPGNGFPGRPSSEENRKSVVGTAQAPGTGAGDRVVPLSADLRALDEGLSSKQRGNLVRENAAATHTDPFGNQMRYSRETLDRWIRRYRGGGFEAPVPARRRLAALPRPPTECAARPYGPDADLGAFVEEKHPETGPG